MDFTREPIIETIITPKEGYKLVIRSSKSTGQEEYFVDAVEIVAFGHGLFFRSLERPKAFLVPVSDYEVLEVREARMVLKNAGLDRSIKIGGGREGNLKANREVDKEDTVTEEREQEEIVPQGVEASTIPDGSSEVRVDKKRDRRRHYRKRKGAREEREEGGVKEENIELAIPPLEEGKIVIQPPADQNVEANTPLSPTTFSALLQPPPTLISETINRYRQNELFRGAFYLTEEEQYKPHDKVQELLNEEDEDENVPLLQEPAFVGEVSHSEIEETHLNDESLESQNVEAEGRGAKHLLEEENLLMEEQKEEKQHSLFFENDEENESQAALPLYAEEDISSSTMESFDDFEGEEDLIEKDPHVPHNDSTI